MSNPKKPIRVLYSFPHKLGADRICYTAWQQVNGLSEAGAEILAFLGVLHRPVPAGVKVHQTLAVGKLRISYKLVGTMRALAMHDRIVARRLPKLVGQIDIIHTWPDAALETLQVAQRLNIPTVLERPNAHTRYAYESVRDESERLGIVLPPNNEYAFKPDVLEKEEKEYALADYLLCPSDFTIKTFLAEGFRPDKLKKHQYGYDEKSFYPQNGIPRDSKSGLTMLFCGGAAVRKGLHFALEAWLQSTAHRNGTFLIAGEILPAYKEKLASKLSDPSVRVLGHRSDVAELMRKSDVLVLPSIEEGAPLVCSEAIGSGCVPLVSEAAAARCTHMENALVHAIGDVSALTQHMNLLDSDRALLIKLRTACVSYSVQCTWKAAGVRLLDIYREILAEKAVRAN